MTQQTSAVGSDMNDVSRHHLMFILGVAALVATPACPRSVGIHARRSFAPHAQALILAMAHDAERQSGPAVADCRSAVWTVVRPFAPGTVDSTGWLHVRMCREGSPCRDSYVDVWEGRVSESTWWSAGAPGFAQRTSLHPLDVRGIGPRSPRADAALLLVVSHDDSDEQLANPRSEAWFDTDARTWRVESLPAVDGTQGCARWIVTFSVGDRAATRWSVDASAGAASRMP